MTTKAEGLIYISMMICDGGDWQIFCWFHLKRLDLKAMDAALNVFTTGNKSGERAERFSVLYLVHGHPDHEIYKVVVSPEVAVQGAVVFRILIIMITKVI